MKKTIIAVVAGLVLAGAGVAATALTTQPATKAAVQAPAKLQTARLAIDNMTCATCPITVRRAMEGVAGVHNVKVDFDAKTATARFDPARTTIKAVAYASTNAGYPARSIDADHL